MAFSPATVPCTCYWDHGTCQNISQVWAWVTALPPPGRVGAAFSPLLRGHFLRVSDLTRILLLCSFSDLTALPVTLITWIPAMHVCLQFIHTHLHTYMCWLVLSRLALQDWMCQARRNFVLTGCTLTCLAQRLGYSSPLVSKGLIMNWWNVERRMSMSNRMTEWGLFWRENKLAGVCYLKAIIANQQQQQWEEAQGRVGPGSVKWRRPAEPPAPNHPL